MPHQSVSQAILAAKQPRVIPFLVGAWPCADSFAACLKALDDAGAAVIEVGIPFSDPIADGPVIAQAMHEALERGGTAKGVLTTVRSLRPTIRAQLVAMVSASIVERLDSTRPCRPFAQHGFDGIIVPDADPSTVAALRQSADAEGISFTALVAPTTDSTRARELSELATGFVYAMARKGLTGSSGQAALDIAEVGRTVSQIRTAATAPVAVGFGIASAEDVAAVTAIADAAIVGTPFIQAIRRAMNCCGSASANGDASASAAHAVEALYATLRGGASAHRSAHSVNSSR